MVKRFFEILTMLSKFETKKSYFNKYLSKYFSFGRIKYYDSSIFIYLYKIKINQKTTIFNFFDLFYSLKLYKLFSCLCIKFYYIWKNL